MKLNDFLSAMEVLAPAALACEWDNVGLIIGSEKSEIKKVLVALDCSITTAQEAIECGADLMLTHHPLFFAPVRSISPLDPATAPAYMLIRHGIALFSAHTNLDSADGGVNDCLANALGLQNIAKLPPENMGRTGDIAPTTLDRFAAFVESALGTRVRICGNGASPVSRVAVLGGAGAEEISAAKAAGADAFVTGEMKHHMALQAQALGICIVEAGHYETERVVLEPLIEHLQRATNDVQYKLAMSESPCLRGI